MDVMTGQVTIPIGCRDVGNVVTYLDSLAILSSQLFLLNYQPRKRTIPEPMQSDSLNKWEGYCRSAKEYGKPTHYGVEKHREREGGGYRCSPCTSSGGQRLDPSLHNRRKHNNVNSWGRRGLNPKYIPWAHSPSFKNGHINTATLWNSAHLPLRVRIFGVPRIPFLSLASLVFRFRLPPPAAR